MAIFSNQVITVSSSVETLTVPSGYPTGAVIYVGDNPIRITLHGANPNNTTKNGIVLSAGTTFEITGIRDMKSLRMIKSGASDAVVSVNYEQGN